MAFKWPKVTVDPSALRHGIWGNTWREWFWIMAAFGVLYGLLAGYLTGMLFAAKGIRQDRYRTMSGKYFGDFDRTLFNASIATIPASGGVKDPHYFNRPDGCTPIEVSAPLSAEFPDITVTRPNGILDCSNADKQWRWTVYPWVLETNGLGNFPGCSNPNGTQGTSASYLSEQYPAGADAGPSTEQARAAYVCHNYVPATAQ